jgi:formamidopyrimidine-DNA glycosylase
MKPSTSRYRERVPELPQMQALAERLDAAVGGWTLEGYEPIGFSGLKTVVPAPESLLGRTLEHVGRFGKYLSLEFGDAGRILIHLSQAGRVDLEEPPKKTRGKGGVVRLRFGTDTAEGGRRVGVFVREFGTERKAAWWVLAPGDDGPLEKLGPEPDTEAFAELILHGDDGRRVHTILRDQRTVTGVGRGYADDALWRAQLSPYASLSSLDADERARLLDAVRAVIADGLELERKRTGGLAENKLGEHFEVHARHGTPCPRCGETLRRVSYESYEVTYCPACQTGGKVLADRRLSRLVK